MKTKLFIPLIVFLLSSLLVHAQTPGLQWVKTMGAAESQVGYSITTDADGNVFTSGVFHHNVDFDPGPGTSILMEDNFGDIFFQKLDGNGNLIWAKRLGGSSFERETFIDCDASGNMYAAGTYQGFVDFDPGPGIQTFLGEADPEMFVLKLDPAGNFIWAKQIGAPGEQQPQGMVADANGNTYITGIFEGVVDFDPGPAAATLDAGFFRSTFILKLDPNGDFLWVRHLEAPSDDSYGSDIQIDANGNVYTTGWFSGIAQLNTGTPISLTSAGGSDIFILKLDSNGNLVWARSMGGTDHDRGKAITVDAELVYTAGTFRSTADLDPLGGTANLTSLGQEDVFIQKLADNGTFLWATQLGGVVDDNVNDITVDGDGNVYTTGDFKDIADFDPGAGIVQLTSVGNQDIFIQKLDTWGDYLWAVAIGGTWSDIGWSIHAEGFDHVYTTGSFGHTVDFDPGSGNTNSVAAGLDDIFVHKLSQEPCTPTAGTDVISACNSIIWIDGMTYTSSNTTATHIIPNASGCDSTVTLNLSINPINTSATQANDVLTAVETGASYQWFDCQSMQSIPGASNQTFVATSNGDYAVAITNNGCTDTSACYTVVAAGIFENGFDTELHIYPNPTSGPLYIDLGEIHANITLTLSDLSGRIVSSSVYHRQQVLTIQMEQPAGTYFLLIKSGKHEAIVRVVTE